MALKLIAVLGLAGTIACDDADAGETTPAAETPRDPAKRAAAIATELKASPDNAEQVLAKHDLTIEEFERLMYEVAADPEMSEAYQVALASNTGK
jgi:hypothetical protein